MQPFLIPVLVALIALVVPPVGYAADINSHLIEAAKQGDTATVQALLEQGADVDAKTDGGRTAMIWAAVKGHTDTVEALLAHGADVNAKVLGWTALMWAEEGGHTETVEALLAAGADPTDNRGRELIQAAQLGLNIMHWLSGLLPDHTDSATSPGVQKGTVAAQGKHPESDPLREQSENTQQNSRVFHIGGSVSAPRLIYKVEPEYSERALAARITGTVWLRVEVWPDGKAHNIRVLRMRSGGPIRPILTLLESGLDEKAIEAVRQWKFQPGMKDGKPVKVAARIEVNFELVRSPTLLEEPILPPR